jgi:hypothetical protein
VANPVNVDSSSYYDNTASSAVVESSAVGDPLSVAESSAVAEPVNVDGSNYYDNTASSLIAESSSVDEPVSVAASSAVDKNSVGVGHTSVDDRTTASSSVHASSETQFTSVADSGTASHSLRSDNSAASATEDSRNVALTAGDSVKTINAVTNTPDTVNATAQMRPAKSAAVYLPGLSVQPKVEITSGELTAPVSMISLPDAISIGNAQTNVSLVGTQQASAVSSNNAQSGVTNASTGLTATVAQAQNANVAAANGATAHSETDHEAPAKPAAANTGAAVDDGATVQAGVNTAGNNATSHLNDRQFSLNDNTQVVGTILSVIIALASGFAFKYARSRKGVHATDGDDAFDDEDEQLFDIVEKLKNFMK